MAATTLSVSESPGLLQRRFNKRQDMEMPKCHDGEIVYPRAFRVIFGSY